MDSLLTLHVCAVAFWFGVVGCEFVIERSRSESQPHGFAVARNHFWIDVLLELPSALVVLMTGILLLRGVEMTTVLAAKVLAGVGAVGVNFACLVPVALRRKAATRADLNQVIRHSRTIDRISAFGVPAGVAALLIGMLPP